jgi:hypothetical protein
MEKYPAQSAMEYPLRMDSKQKFSVIGVSYA